MILEVAGRRVQADFTRAGDHWSLLVRPSGALDGRLSSSHELGLRVVRPGIVEVVRKGSTAQVEIERTWWNRRMAPVRGAGTVDGPVAVTAPMPGRVVKVLVRAGEMVRAGQGLVVVEAMKMENELRAPLAAVVAEVRVSEGSPVDARAVLLVLAAEAET